MGKRRITTRQPFRYGGFELGQLKGECVAIKKEDSRRSRYRLGVSRYPEDGARAALIAFVDALTRHETSGDPVINDVWDWYQAKLADEGKNTRSSESVHRLNVAPVIGKLRVSALTDELCREFAKGQDAKGQSRGYIWRQLNNLRSAMRWAYKKGRITIPAHDRMWVPSQEQPKQRVLSPEEACKLLDAAKSRAPHIHLFTLLCLCTTARHTAILELTWDRVDLEAGTIDFRTEKARKSILDKSAQKNRAVVPFGSLLRAALSAAKASARSQYVIEYGANTKPLYRLQSFRDVADSVGLTDVTPHTLRHTGATWLSGGGHDEHTISKMLGNTPDVARRVYIKPEVDPLRKAQGEIEKKVGGLKPV